MALWERASQDFINELARRGPADIRADDFWVVHHRLAEPLAAVVLLLAFALAVYVVSRYQSPAWLSIYVTQPAQRKFSRVWSRFATWWMA